MEPLGDSLHQALRHRSRISTTKPNTSVRLRRSSGASLQSRFTVSVPRRSATLGAKDNDIIAYAKPATPRVEALTANNQTPYITAFTDLSKGPVVLVLPAATEKANLYGQIVDAWQVTIGESAPQARTRARAVNNLLLPHGLRQAGAGRLLAGPIRPITLAYSGCMITPDAAGVTSDGFVAIGTCWAERPADTSNVAPSVVVRSFVFIGSFGFIQTTSLELLFPALVELGPEFRDPLQSTFFHGKDRWNRQPLNLQLAQKGNQFAPPLHRN